jgi:hypothetical protein
LGEQRQLRLAIAHVGAQATLALEGAVGQDGRRVAVLGGHHLVVEALLGIAGDGGLVAGVAVQARRRHGVARRHPLRGGEQFGALVQQREAKVAVIEHHVGHGAKALVGHHVADEQAGFAEAGPDTPGEGQVLAKDHRLAHAAAHPHLVFVATPGAVSPHAFRRQMVQAAVQPQRLALVHAGRAGAGEAAAGHQAAVEGAQPAQPFAFVIGGMRRAGRGLPGEGGAVELGGADIHAAIQQHLQAESRAGLDLGVRTPRLLPSARSPRRTPPNWLTRPTRCNSSCCVQLRPYSSTIFTSQSTGRPG